jgi:hypothetical protein
MNSLWQAIAGTQTVQQVNSESSSSGNNEFVLPVGKGLVTYSELLPDL